jgi:hypothetical protein
MKNIEKIFVTIALFLFTVAWLLFVFVVIEQNVIILTLQAQIYNNTFASPEKSTTSNSLKLPSASETVPSSEFIPFVTPSPNTIQNVSKPEALKPNGRFIYPLSGNLISSKVEVKFEVYDSTSVEFYIKRSESSTETYLGYSRVPTNNVWSYYWDSASTPNGNYYIIPYILNGFGRYAGNKVYVTVNNQVEQSATQINQLKEQIISTQDSIQNQEEKLIQIQNQMKVSVNQKTQEISNNVNTAVSPEKSTIVKKELDVLSFKIMNNSMISQKQELDKSKQEITVKAKEVSDLVATSSDDQAKTEEIRRKIGNLAVESIGQLDRYFFEKQTLEQTEKDLIIKDSDNDGLSDNEEIRLKSDPFNPDSDGDGFLDGTEVKLGYDPLSASSVDKVVYQNPKDVKALVSEIYQVEKVELVESPQNKAEKVLKLMGKAPANSFVTIYIYSTPTIVVAKADENGNWEYTLDKPLADGRHTVYASVTNNKGDIEKISQSFDFAKAEDTIIKLLTPTDGTAESPAQNLNRIFMIMIVIAVVVAIVFVVLVLGVYLSQHNK